MPDAVTPSPKARRALLIENIFEKETSESFIERHFPARAIHRAKHADEYEVARVAADHPGWILRSTQELEPDPDSSEFRTVWTNLILKTPEEVIWHFVKKTNNYGKSDNEYQLTVVADDPLKAARDVREIHKRYLPGVSGPSFFLCRELRPNPFPWMKPTGWMMPGWTCIMAKALLSGRKISSSSSA